MGNEPSNEPAFAPPPEEGGGSNAANRNFLTANTTNHRRAIMLIAAMLYGVFMSVVVYKTPLTFREIIFPPIVGLVVFEFMFRARNRLTLATLAAGIVIVLFASTVMYGILYSVSYGSFFWSPVIAFTSLFTEFPYNLYALLEAATVTTLAFYLIKAYRKESWQVHELVSTPADASAPPEPVTGLPGFLRRYDQQIGAFFGWYVVASLLVPFSFGLITTPLTIILMIGFGLSKTRKGLAGGILVAVALNFVVSLIQGLNLNAVCFIPFYFDTGF